MRLYLVDIEKSLTPYSIPVTNTNRDLQYLPIGNEGDVLTVVGGEVVWAVNQGSGQNCYCVSEAQALRWEEAYSWGDHSIVGYELMSNKVNDFTTINDTTYPTTLAVWNLIQSLPMPLDGMLTINSSGIASGGGIFTANQGADTNITIYVPPTNLSSIVSGNTVYIYSSTGGSTSFVIPSSGTINDGQLDISTTGIATGGGTFTANQSTDSSVVVHVPPTNLTSEVVGDTVYIRSSTGDDTSFDIPSGGVINDGILTISSGTGLSGSTTFTANQATNSNVTLSLSHLGIENLADPNVDRLLFWDDSAGYVDWLQLGTNISISGKVLNATNTVTRLRGTASGTFVSGDITLLAGTNVTITQAGTNITVASTNTTYTAGDGLTLTGTVFSLPVTVTGSGNAVTAVLQTATGLTVEKNSTFLTSADLTPYALKATTLTINGVTQDLSANRTWTISTVSNLSIGTRTSTTLPINNSNGTGVILPQATTTLAGLMTAADKTKLDGLSNYVLPIASDTVLGGVKVGAGLSIDGSGVLSASFDSEIFIVVSSLPTVGETNKIYLVPAASPQPSNVFEEWIYQGGEWELIGTSSIDLSNYYTKSETDSLIKDGVLTLNTGTGLSGSTTFTANQATNSTFTVALNAVLNNLNDVSISSPGTGQLLRFNGTSWANWTPNFLTTNQSITWTGSGDVTGTASGTTSINPTLTIANNAVTFPKLQDISTQTLIGRYSAGTGDPQSVTIGAGLLLNASGVLSVVPAGTVTSVAVSSTDLSVSGSPITTSGTFVLDINDNAVTNTKLRDSAGLSVIGRSTFTAGDPADIIASVNNTVLRRSGTSISFSTIGDAFITDLAWSKITGAPSIPTVNDGTLALATSGIATGSQTFTANQASNATFTVNVPGTNVNGNLVGTTLNLTSSTGTGGSINLSSLYTGGTVTSVGVSSTDLSVSGSPVTSSGTITLNINNNAVTLAKLQDIPTQTLLGRYSTGTGDPQTITVGSGLTLTTGGVLSATGSGGTVTSVGLSMPAAFSVSGSPVTSSGTLTVTGAGTTSQYIRGDGSLATFPTITAVNNGALTLNTSGIATGSATFTANQATGSSFTVNVPGTDLGSSLSGNNLTITSSTGGNTTVDLSTLTTITPTLQQVTVTGNVTNQSIALRNMANGSSVSPYESKHLIGRNSTNDSGLDIGIYTINSHASNYRHWWKMTVRDTSGGAGEKDAFLLNWDRQPTFNYLEGTGTRMVVASATGALSTQAITTGTVTSVGMTIAGSALNVTPATITSSGTFALTWAGTISQYIRGDGSLATFPTITAVNNGALTMNTSGIATGSATFTANQATGSTFTVNVPGTNLGSSLSGNNLTITSSTGTNTVIDLSGLTTITPNLDQVTDVGNSTTNTYFRIRSSNGSLTTPLAENVIEYGVNTGNYATIQGLNAYSVSARTGWAFNTSVGSTQTELMRLWINGVFFSQLTGTGTRIASLSATGELLRSTIDPSTIGTVTSVGLTMPSGFSVSGSPVTSSGTLAVTTTLNGYIKGNGSGFTASTTIPYTDITGAPAIPTNYLGNGTSSGLALISTTSPDLNTLSLANGGFVNNATNTPYGTVSGTVFTLANANVGMQTFMRGIDDAYWYRMKSSGTYGTWHQIASRDWVTSIIPSDYITTNTTQTSLSGNKSTTGKWTIGSGTEGSAVRLNVVGPDANNSDDIFLLNTGVSNTRYAIKNGTPTAGIYYPVIEHQSNTSIGTQYRVYNNTTGFSNYGFGFRIYGAGGSGAASSGIHTVFTNAGTTLLSLDYQGIITSSNLAGTGTRMVVANSTGVLSTQAITTGTVTSVAASVAGSALNVAGTPITSSGTLAFTWAGTSGQYVNGLGNLVTFPTIPTVNDGTLTIQKEGVAIGTFTANQSTPSTINIIETDPKGVASMGVTGTTTKTITLTLNDASTVTANFTDLNTTYTGSTSITLSGTSFQRAALTGDVTAAANSNTTTIANNVVTFPKIQDIPTQTFIGRYSAGTGDPQSITLGTGLSLSGAGELSATNNGTVTSVDVSGSGALTFSGGPVTASGTIAAGWSGTTAQYVRGNGTLATFPLIPEILTGSYSMTSVGVPPLSHVTIGTTTVPGAVLNNPVTITQPSNELLYKAKVTAPNTVTIYALNLTNVTTSTIVETLQIKVFK